MADERDATFLFTDIVASTELWEQHPSQMAETMDRHDQLTTSVVERHRGQIIDFSGDGAFAVFHDPVNAVLSSVDLQLRFTSESWNHGGPLPIRTGVHTGSAVVRTGRYSGPEVHRAARIMQQAVGSQILISEATMNRSQDRLDRLFGFQEVGTVALRGLRHSERIFEVRHPGMAPPIGRPARRRRTRVLQDLMERDNELTHLQRAWADAVEGSGSVVVISGEAGIGKSALVRAFADHIDDGVVLLGTCDDLSTARSFGAIRDLAIDASGPLGSVAFTEREAVFGALISELRRQPSVVVVEDVQWADDATLDAITLLARRIDRLPALLVLTTRPLRREATPILEAVGGASWSSTLTLEPLSSTAVHALAVDAPLDGDELYRLTGGNPLFVTELLTADGTDLPTSVRQSVLARLRPLDDRVKQGLDKLAVVPGAVERWLAEMVLDDLAILDEASAAGLLALEPEVIRFRHELTRRTIEGSIPPDRRRSLHGTVAGLLSDAGAEHAAVAHHAFAARLEGLVREHVPAAIEEAIASGSHRQALELISRFEPYLGAADGPLRGWVERQRAEAFYALDRAAEALAASRTAVRLARADSDPIAAAEALSLVGRISWWLRDMAGSAAAATEALDTIDGLEPDESVARILASLARLLALARDAKATAVAERALDVAGQVGSRQSVALAQMALGLAGDLDGLIERMLEAISEARLAGDGHTEALATTNLSTALVFSHRYDEAERWLPVAQDRAERFEQNAALSISTGLSPWVRAMRGDLEGALEGLVRYEEAMEEENQRAWGTVHRAVVLARLGRTDEAQDLLRTARGHRIGRAVDPMLVFEAAEVEVNWLAGLPIDGDRIRDETLLKNLHAFPQDYLGRLGRGLQRAGFEVPVLDVGVGAYDLAMADRGAEAAAQWESLGNPYECGVELSLAGDPHGREMLEGIGAMGAVWRLWPEANPG